MRCGTGCSAPKLPKTPAQRLGTGHWELLVSVLEWARWGDRIFFRSFYFFLISWSSLFWVVDSFCLLLLSPAFKGRHRIREAPWLCSVTALELNIVIYI